jgi:hypothetical protein
MISSVSDILVSKATEPHLFQKSRKLLADDLFQRRPGKTLRNSEKVSAILLPRRRSGSPSTEDQFIESVVVRDFGSDARFQSAPSPWALVQLSLPNPEDHVMDGLGRCRIEAFVCRIGPTVGNDCCAIGKQIGNWHQKPIPIGSPSR